MGRGAGGVDGPHGSYFFVSGGVGEGDEDDFHQLWYVEDGCGGVHPALPSCLNLGNFSGHYGSL